MQQAGYFNQVLENTEKLSLYEQENLLEILQKRIVESKRKQLAKDILEANREFKEGNCKKVTVDELMEEILS